MMSRHILAIAVATLLAGTAVAEAATEFVVVQARGIKMKAGDKIDGEQKLTLAEGQQLSMMAPNGTILKWQGPKDEAPADEVKGGSTADISGALAAMVTSNKVKTELGVTRDAGKKPLPDPWLIDVTTEGNSCIVPGEAVRLWRPDSAGEGKLVISPSDRSWQGNKEWAAGSDNMLMPSSVPLHDRATYVINLDGEQKRVTLVAIPAAMNNDLMRLSFMWDKDCLRQAAALQKKITASAVAQK